MRSRTWGFIPALLLTSGSAVAQPPPDNLPVSLEAGATSKHPALTEVDAPLARLIINWLSRNFDLPAASPAPRIVLASTEAMESLRHRNALAGSRTGKASDIVAIYVDAERTVYLREGWNGTSPAEQSVLVHEMVHHLQNLTGIAYACTEERERLAYAAQGAWLSMFGSDLSQEFGIDPFTILARSLCPI